MDGSILGLLTVSDVTSDAAQKALDETVVLAMYLLSRLRLCMLKVSVLVNTRGALSFPLRTLRTQFKACNVAMNAGGSLADEFDGEMKGYLTP